MWTWSYAEPSSSPFSARSMSAKAALPLSCRCRNGAAFDSATASDQDESVCCLSLATASPAAQQHDQTDAQESRGRRFWHDRERS